MNKSRNGIYLLPNLITTTSLLLGFYAVVCAFSGDFDTAVLMVLICVILDGMDGQVARRLNLVSRFGAEFDSLTDAVSFGVAPALVTYLWLSSNVAITGIADRIVWLVAFLYTASTVLRLARFNVQLLSAEKDIFRGLPSTAAAALVMTFIWSWQDLISFSPNAAAVTLWISLAILVLLSAAMVSNFSYYSLKGLRLRNRVSFITIFTAVAIFAIAAIDLPRFLFFTALTYAFSGPVIYLMRLVRRQQKNRHLSASRHGVE